jgi:hypothetical protein
MRRIRSTHPGNIGGGRAAPRGSPATWPAFDGDAGGEAVTRRRAELASRHVASELSALGRLACDATNLRPQAKVFGDPADR